MVSDKSEVWETGQKSLHFVTAQETASSSNSMIVYCISVSDRNLELAWMRNQMCPFFAVGQIRDLAIRCPEELEPTKWCYES